MACNSDEIDAIAICIELDRIFSQLINSIGDALLQGDRWIQVRVRRWVTKLKELTQNVVWKRNRNSYAKLLVDQLKHGGSLVEPFDVLPMEGHLPSLPLHMKCRFTPSSRSPSPAPSRPKQLGRARPEAQLRATSCSPAFVSPAAASYCRSQESARVLIPPGDMGRRESTRSLTPPGGMIRKQSAGLLTPQTDMARKHIYDVELGPYSSPRFGPGGRSYPQQVSEPLNKRSALVGVIPEVAVHALQTELEAHLNVAQELQWRLKHAEQEIAMQGQVLQSLPSGVDGHFIIDKPPDLRKTGSAVQRITVTKEQLDDILDHYIRPQSPRWSYRVDLLP
eukprot:gene21061-27940_t